MKIFELVNLGQGSYGFNGTPIAQENLLKIFDDDGEDVTPVGAGFGLSLDSDGNIRFAQGEDYKTLSYNSLGQNGGLFTRRDVFNGIMYDEFLFEEDIPFNYSFLKREFYTSARDPQDSSKTTNASMYVLSNANNNTLSEASIGVRRTTGLMSADAGSIRIDFSSFVGDFSGLNYGRVVDTINNRGLEYAGDYEGNFIARSLVTKQYVDNNFVTLATNQTNINGAKRFNNLVRFRMGSGGQQVLHTSFEYPDADGEDYSLRLYNNAAGNNVKWHWNQVITLAILGGDARLDYPVLGFRNGITLIGSDSYPTGAGGLGVETYYNNQSAPVTRFPLRLYSVGDAMFTGRIYAGKSNFDNTLFLTSANTLYSEGTAYIKEGLRTKDAANTAILDGSTWLLGNAVTHTSPHTPTHDIMVRINGTLYRIFAAEVV